MQSPLTRASWCSLLSLGLGSLRLAFKVLADRPSSQHSRGKCYIAKVCLKTNENPSKKPQTIVLPFPQPSIPLIEQFVLELLGKIVCTCMFLPHTPIPWTPHVTLLYEHD